LNSLGKFLKLFDYIHIETMYKIN